MNCADVYIVVEGQTEQTFVRDVLARDMAHKGIYLYPALIGKPGHKGGDIRFERARNDIGHFLRLRKNAFVSTMFDFYRIDAGWPGRAKVREDVKSGAALTAQCKGELIESAMHNEIVEVFAEVDPGNRFIPYIQMHEFEALLFSDVRILSEIAEIKLSLLKEIRDGYANPEEIDETPHHAPSARLRSLKPGYRKVAMGKMVAEAISVQAIRNQCPHFDAWLKRLERLSENVDDKADQA